MRIPKKHIGQFGKLAKPTFNDMKKKLTERYKQVKYSNQSLTILDIKNMYSEIEAYKETMVLFSKYFIFWI